MTYIAKKTLQYQTRPGVLFDLKEGEEVAAKGFDLEELRRAGAVKKKGFIEIALTRIKPLPTVAEEAEAASKAKAAKAAARADEEAEAEAPKKRGRPKKTEEN